jgi:hypothetical protein
MKHELSYELKQLLQGPRQGRLQPRLRPRGPLVHRHTSGSPASRRRADVRTSAICVRRPGPPHLGSEGRFTPTTSYGGPGSLQLGHLRTVDRLAMSSTSPTRCPTTGTGRRRRRIRRLHERIRPPQRKNNATHDFQHEVAISNSLSYSGTHATNVGNSGRLSGGPETYLPMIVDWCWKCMVG